MRKKIRLGLLIQMMLLGALFACDSGSSINFSAAGTDQCKVKMVSNRDGYTTELELKCAKEGHKDCFTITAISCGGSAKTIEKPVAVDKCPGSAYCVTDCKAGLQAPGHLWDMPNLKTIPGCDPYAR